MEWQGILGAALGGAIGAALARAVGASLPDRVRGVVTVVLAVALAAGGSFAARHFFSNPEAQVERALMADPGMRPLAEAWRESEPESFGELLAYLGANARGLDQASIINATRDRFVRVVQPRYLYLTDAQVGELLDIARQQMAELKISQPQICQPLFHGGAFGDVRPYLSAPLLDREQQLLVTVMRAPAVPQPIYSSGSVESSVSEILAATQAVVGEDVALLEPTAQIAGREARMCEVAEEFFTQYKARPPEEAGALLRTLMTGA